MQLHRVIRGRVLGMLYVFDLHVKVHMHFVRWLARGWAASSSTLLSMGEENAISVGNNCEKNNGATRPKEPEWMGPVRRHGELQPWSEGSGARHHLEARSCRADWLIHLIVVERATVCDSKKMWVLCSCNYSWYYLVWAKDWVRSPVVIWLEKVYKE